MTADRTYAFPTFRCGMDHEHFDWSALNATRAKLAWPGDAHVALCVIVTLEHAEWKPPPHDAVWKTTGAKIVEHYRSVPA